MSSHGSRLASATSPQNAAWSGSSAAQVVPTLSDLPRWWEILIVLTQKEIRVRYKHSWLGYLWSIANPLCYALVFYIAFDVVMKVRIEGGGRNYVLFLITGLFPWQWISNSVGVAHGIYLGNASITKKCNFPRHLLPMAIVAQDCLHFVMSLPIIAIFMLMMGRIPSWQWIYGVPLLLALQTAIAYSLVLLVSSINLFFRDLEKIVQILLVYLFYFTPVLYPLSKVPESLRIFVYINPLGALMVCWRDLLFDGFLAPLPLLATAISAVLWMAFAHLVYGRLVWRFAEVV